MSTVSTPAYAYLSRGDHIHRHCPPVDSILRRIPVSHSASVSTAANRHGHSKASQVCLRCCSDNFVTSSLSERVRCDQTCLVGIHLSWCLLRWYSFTVIATCVCKTASISEVLIYSIVTLSGRPGIQVSQSLRSARNLFG